MWVLFRIYFDLIRLHINITTDCVLNLSELTLVCLTKTLVESEKLVTDRYKKVLLYKINVSARINQRQKDIYIYIYIFSCRKMIAIDFLLTYCQLTLIYCPYFCIMLVIRSEIMKWGAPGSPPPYPVFLKLENTKFLLVNNMWDFSLFIEEDISDKK